MEYTQIITAAELDRYADTRDSEAVVPELISMLVKECVTDLATCRIPYGDAINQPGWDGLVETESGFHQFVPAKKSFWEIGTGADPQKKATKDFRARKAKLSPGERSQATYVFVTPRGASAGGWSEPAQTKWKTARSKSGWGGIKILDAVQICDWLREFPAIAKWLLKRIGTIKTISGLTTPAEHWENLQQLSSVQNDPHLPPQLFLVGREQASGEMLRLFRGEIKQVILAAEVENDVEDFIAALLASLDTGSRRLLANRCLLVKDPDVWLSMCNLRNPHVLIGHPSLDLEDSGEQLHMTAIKNGHAVVISVSGNWTGGSEKFVPLRNPSASSIEKVLTEHGYPHERARELAAAGALSLPNLKRHLRGLGELPAYGTWQTARLLAQAQLFGRWSGENAADKSAMEIALGKSYGEWIETVRPETLRSDTPLIQRNENWKIISRGEVWTALGPRLSNEDLDKFQLATLAILGERDPKLELDPDQRFAASVHGKMLKHSSSIRRGVAETLALLGSRPHALTSCSQGKPELVALLTVRSLLKDVDWVIWASLDSELPMLAEAAPDEFLDAVESALLHPAKSPFNTLFAQERAGIMGRNYTSGLLWALETLAWHPDYLQRVTVLLGELAAIDPGGNWANRPSNSLTDIFLPWHPQTCAPINKRRSAVEALVKEQPTVGWKLLMSLLPSAYGATSGCRKPAWRRLIPAEWIEKVSEQEYWEQVSMYADLVIETAKADLEKLAELIDALPNLPEAAHSRVLDHLASQPILNLDESARLPVWEALLDLARKHRKFPDAQWVMPPNLIQRIESVASRMAPTRAELLHQRLFSDRDFELFDEVGNYEEQQEQLNLRRQSAVREILSGDGLEGLLKFAGTVTNSGTVGNALGCIEWPDADAALLPKYLGEPDKVLRDFTSNFVWGRFRTKSWPWVDATFSSAWTLEQKVTFLSFLPFRFETWRRAEALLGHDSPAYWKVASVNPYGSQPHLLEAVERLITHGRPYAAISCLSRLLHQKVDVPTQLATRALADAVTTSEPPRGLVQHNLLEIIKWLQENPATDPNVLFEIEWAYLPLLDHHPGGRPKILEQRLASDPAFFCQVIGIVFRSDKDEAKDRQPSESERAIAKNAYRLLNGWKTVPGSSAEGAFDGKAFKAWLEEVTRRTKESGHFRIGMDQIGQVLPYAPSDPGGLWIHRDVAEILNAKEAGDMRAGFTCELFNMRGVYGFTAGKEEREIAGRFHKQAEALEQHGYHRFATAVRELAKQYERDAERQANRNPFDE